MTRVRLLPVVILLVGALLVLKVFGLLTQGHYVLTGPSQALAAGGGGDSGAHGGAEEPAATTTLQLPTLTDNAPTLANTTPTLGEEPAAEGGHGAPAEGEHEAPAEAPAEGEHGAEPVADAEQGAEDPLLVAEAAAVPAEGEGHGSTNTVADFNACAPRPVGEETEGGQLTVISGDCPPLTDAKPQLTTPSGNVDLGAGDPTLTEQVLLDRLVARRGELESYEQELALRAALIDAAEKRVGERTSTLEALEAQIATLVDERKRLEEEQFTAIVSMYQTMKPKDAAGIFNALEIDILVRVAKMMPPRKMAPILADMDTARAQELTVRLAAETSENPEQMGAADLAALPQIVGQ